MKVVPTAEGASKSKKMMQEVKILKSLDHPHIVKFVDCFIDMKGPVKVLCILMEYCSGGDLDSHLKLQEKKGRYFSEREVWNTAW